MSKRGRRRNSKRRKSSTSSKQSVSPYMFQKQNNRNSLQGYKDDIVEKGETDSLRKENVLSGSEDEEKYNDAPPKEKKCKKDDQINSFPNQRTIYLKMTEDKEKGVKTVTSVSVNEMEDSPPKIMFQQTHEPLFGNQTHSSTPVTNVMKINCPGVHLKFEIQEILPLNTSGMNPTETLFNTKCDKVWTPDNELSEHPSQNLPSANGNQNTNYRFTFGSTSEQTEAHSDSHSVSSTEIWGDPFFSQYCSDHKQHVSGDFMLGNHPFLNNKSQGKRKHFYKSFSIEQFWDIPPPQEFADMKSYSLEDLTHNLASCKIGACSPAEKQQSGLHPTIQHEITCNEESVFPVEVDGRADLSPLFDRSSECDSYEPVIPRLSPSINRFSFTKDFVNYQKRKSWIRNNSIATVEHRSCLLPKKRRQTFPGMSEGLGLTQEEFLLPYTESLFSLIMCSLPLQTEDLGTIRHSEDHLSSQSKGSSKLVLESPNSHNGKQSLLSPLNMTSSGDNSDDMLTDVKQSQRQYSIECYQKDHRQQSRSSEQSVCEDMGSLGLGDYQYKVDQSEVADCGFDQEMGKVECHCQDQLAEAFSQRALTMQGTPTSCSGSGEQLLQSNPVLLFPKNMENASQEDLVSVLPTGSKTSFMTITAGALEQRRLLGSTSSQDSCMDKPTRTTLEDSCTSHLQDREVCFLNSNEITEIEETDDVLLDTGGRNTLLSHYPAVTLSCPSKGSADTDIPSKEQLSKTAKQTLTRYTKEHLKPVVHKDSESSGSDHWAKRRKLFRDSKQWSSAGGSSITSDITEESVSEDTRSMDMTVRDNEDRGFYTETFHSSAWIYQGGDDSPGAGPPGINTRTRAVSIRERTVKISKGTGEYPWGFRIQFSKPIVVTEVDTNGAAEEAGLIVGDYVLAVNGTDVTSIPHSEAANLARQGPDLLTLTIGSDIARCPNTPRPACRGYLHKRTQSGLIKGWRKRWFVLTHDCCLYYYRHKRDEGKRRALSAVKLEGAEVGQDISLGKPFVFKCRPQSVNRVYFFCATSNQEMKRWLEAMEKAIYPITQNHVWEDVARHNSNLPPLAVKHPECLGLLHKMDKDKDMWVQHYCILKDGCLFLYSGIRATHAHGGVYLHGYMVREQPYGSKKSTIELKPPSEEFKTFYFCAENPNDNKRWIAAIKVSIKKWLPLHQALQDYMNRPHEETRM